jgi:hypothetical protein
MSNDMSRRRALLLSLGGALGLSLPTALIASEEAEAQATTETPATGTAPATETPAAGTAEPTGTSGMKRRKTRRKGRRKARKAPAPAGAAPAATAPAAQPQ